MPAWARWLLAIVPLGDRREDVTSDLAELFGDRFARYGRVHAHRRLCGDVVSLWRGTRRGGVMFHDLQFALRLFRKHPLPVGITLGGLALAIGITTSVFSIINVSMLQPYAMDQPSSVVAVGSSGHNAFAYWPYAQFLKMREEATLSRVEASNLEKVRFSTQASSDVDSGRWLLFVSGGYLDLLGGRPSIGRAIGPADDTPGAPPVVMVSHHLWSTELNRDPAAVGRTIWLNGAAATVVGVMRPEFTGPRDVGFWPAVWAPFAAVDDLRMGLPYTGSTKALVEVIARLESGVAMSAAQDNLAAVIRRTAAPSSHAAADRPPVNLYSVASPMDGPDAAENYLGVAAMLGIVGLVLALACANTANLLLAAAATRMREIGIRLAMGATRRRLVQQMVSESLLLGLLAGGLGFLFAIWFTPVLGAMTQMPPDVDVRPTATVLLFTIAVAIVCGLGAGISPARFGARGDVLSAMKSQRGRGIGGNPSRLRTSFVGFQAAVSMLLLVVAALLARTALTMAGTDVGFDADRMVAVSISGVRGAAEVSYTERALAVVRELPPVEDVAVTQYAPFGCCTHRQIFSRDGRSLDREDSGTAFYTLYVHHTDAGFFRTAGVSVLRGRAFTAVEVDAAAPVMLVSDSVARRFFGETDPIGHSLSGAAGFGEPGDSATIIGIVADALMMPLHSQAQGTIYRPISETRSNPPTLLVRTANPGMAARSIEDALRRLDAKVQPSTSIVGERLDAYLGGKRMIARLSGLTALLALVLATLGVHGVTAFSVHQRTQEVSVRMAIGASAADVLRMLVRQSLRPVAIGLAVGLALALGVSRVFASELSGISPHDPIAIVLATTTLLAAAVAAVLIPARRAAATDPAGVLRQV